MLILQQLQNLMVHFNFPHKVFIPAFHCEKAEQKAHPVYAITVPKMQNHLVSFYSIQNNQFQNMGNIYCGCQLVLLAFSSIIFSFTFLMLGRKKKMLKDTLRCVYMSPARRVAQVTALPTVTEVGPGRATQRHSSFGPISLHYW